MSIADASHDAPLRRVRFWQPKLDIERRSDGAVVVRQTEPLERYPDRLTQRLVDHAATAPDRTYLADRDDNGAWRMLTYGEALAAVRRLAQALLDHELSAERPLIILSGNGLEHALLALAAMHVGVAYAPISPAYSLVSRDFAKLMEVTKTLTPGLCFAAEADAYAPAIAAALAPDVPLVTRTGAVEGRRTISYAELAATQPTADVDAAHARVGRDTIAKFLFTSGSTGTPKAVINTHGMLCANQAMVRDCYAFMRDEPPVVLDWAPWNHTAGGNKVFNMVLYNGGTLYIDDGRPAPHLIEKTVRSLREVAPTWYFNVPKGFEELIPHFDADRDLCERFFSRLNMMMYAGASLAQHTWDALERLAVQTTGERVLLATGFGATETSPFALMCTSDHRVAGNLGLPARGLEFKLVPDGNTYEGRIRGPSITPGYWRDPALTADAFDDEGFYRFGDAFRFADPQDPSQGFFFDGRLAENFKLNTGTWVNVGKLRARLIDHFGEVVRDVVLTGLDRDHIGALVVPDLSVCEALAADAEGAADAVPVRDHLKSRLRSFAGQATGSSTLVKRLLVMTEPLSIDRGEITDKGSVNQRAVLRQRADLVEELYTGSPRVITLAD